MESFTSSLKTSDPWSEGRYSSGCFNLMCCWSDPSEPYNLSQNGTSHLNFFYIIYAVLLALFVLFYYELRSTFFDSFSSMFFNRSYMISSLLQCCLVYASPASTARLFSSFRDRDGRKHCRSFWTPGKILIIFKMLIFFAHHPPALL